MENLQLVEECTFEDRPLGIINGLVANGNYTVSLEDGDYTLQLSKEGFLPNVINITLITENSESITGNLVPEGTSLPEGDLRIILTWGSTPTDLDSHLIGPTAHEGILWHVFNYDSASHTITTVNEYVTDYDYSYWGY